MNERPKILIVDDEPYNVDYLEQELDELDYDTISAFNGQEALDQVQAGSPDLVLLDIMMPIMDGFEVLKRLKASPATRDIPVIIISANSDLQSVVKGVKQGAEDYLPKPFEPVLLQARIDAGLAKKRHRDQELEYLRQVEVLTDAANAIQQSAYEPALIEQVASRTDALGELARVFRSMAEEVRTREQRLRRQLQQLQQDIEEKKSSKAETVAVYIPMDRRQALAYQRELAGYTRGAALFADVSGFTKLTESLANELGLQRGAEEIIRHLNQVYSLLIEEVHRYGGSVTNFSGDAITCWFDDLDLQGARRQGSSAERAAASALAMQTAMRQFAALTTPGGTAISLAIKVAIAAGPARRILVGNPMQRQIDVLAGDTLRILAEAEHQANRGEILAAAEGIPQLEQKFIVSEWRDDGRFAVVTGLMQDVAPDSWPLLPEDAIHEDQLKPWMLPAVYEKVRAGKSDMLSELRQVAALFLTFSGLDYDADPESGARLDGFIQWVEEVIAPYHGSIIQLTVGDKGSYLYVVFGAPVAYNDDALQAVRAAMELANPPETLAFITGLQIGLTYGQMRVGAYGGQAHRTYGAIGDMTNLAARLMQASVPPPPGAADNPFTRILCNDTIVTAVGQQIEFTALPAVQLKGKSRPTVLYRPVRIFSPKQMEPAGSPRAMERARQIDHLSPAEQLTLKVASVIGQIFTIESLMAIYPEEDGRRELQKHLDTLAGQDLIVRRSAGDGSYGFKDPITHETAYNLMLFAQRRQLHRAIAEMLETSSHELPPYAELARHWQAAEDIPKAVQYFEKAGQQALELGDKASASRFFNASLALSV